MGSAMTCSHHCLTPSMSTYLWTGHVLYRTVLTPADERKECICRQCAGEAVTKAILTRAPRHDLAVRIYDLAVLYEPIFADLPYHMTWPTRRIHGRDDGGSRSKPTLPSMPLPRWPGPAFNLELPTRWRSRRPGEFHSTRRDPAHPGCGHLAPFTSRHHCAGRRSLP
jgi:hypothetical protein